MPSLYDYEFEAYGYDGKLDGLDAQKAPPSSQLEPRHYAQAQAQAQAGVGVRVRRKVARPRSGPGANASVSKHAPAPAYGHGNRQGGVSQKPSQERNSITSRKIQAPRCNYNSDVTARGVESGSYDARAGPRSSSIVSMTAGEVLRGLKGKGTAPPTANSNSSSKAASTCAPPTPTSQYESHRPPNPVAKTHTYAPIPESEIANSAIVRPAFDPWNSSSTGHQHAENNRLAGSSDWRQSRNLKLGAQFRGGLSGGKGRVADTVGQGSEAFGKDGRRVDGGWERGAKGLRTRQQRSLVEIWGASKGSRNEGNTKENKQRGCMYGASDVETQPKAEHHSSWNMVSGDKVHDTSTPKPHDLDPNPDDQPKPIFDHLTFYLNASTAPLITDHKLKHLIASHGGSLSVSLRRRTITHVILNNNATGGGLAASKIQKELQHSRVGKGGGKSVIFVTVDWVLECVRKGRRLPESGFASQALRGRGQGSVYGMFAKV